MFLISESSFDFNTNDIAQLFFNPTFYLAYVEIYSYIYGIVYFINGSLGWVDFTKILMLVMTTVEVIISAFISLADPSSEYEGLAIVILVLAFVPDMLNNLAIYLLMKDAETV